MKRLCVYCGSSRGVSPAFAVAARQLGEAMVARNIELVFGGSHVGLMGMVADAVLAGGGKVTGVLPHFMAHRELAHPRLTELLLVETMHERKQAMAARADGFVALPGGFGTLEEIFEAMTWAQLHLHPHPCALLNVEGFYDPLVDFLRGTVRSGFVRQELLDSLIVAANVTELFAGFARFQPDPVEKWVPANMDKKTAPE